MAAISEVSCEPGLSPLFDQFDNHSSNQLVRSISLEQQEMI